MAIPDPACVFASPDLREIASNIYAAIRSLNPSPDGPSLLSATVSEDGETLTLVFDSPVSGTEGFSLNTELGGVSVTYTSGEGTDTLVFSIDTTIEEGEEVTLDYVPGDVEDLDGNPLEQITDQEVVNNSDVVADEYSDEVMSDNPIARWRLNDTAPVGAGSVVDTVGGSNGTPNGGITWDQAGPLASGLSAAPLLNGTTGYVSCGAAIASALMNSAAWTVELWFYAGANNGGDIFAAAADATHRVRIQHFNNTIFTTSNAGGNKSSGTLMANSAKCWHYLVLTSAGNLYIDGIAEVGTGSATPNSTNQLTIGALNNGTSFFNGRVSEVAVYNSALSQARIDAHYAAAIQRVVPSGRTFYHNFEQATPVEFPAGSDDTGNMDQGSSLTNAQAFAGVQSLSLGGATFRSMTFDNQTNQNVWASPQRGQMRARFRYNGVQVNFMVFQITGKDRSGVDDTNDGVRLVYTGGNQWTATYSFAGGGSTVTATVTQAVAADAWHLAIVQWDTESLTNKISVTINASSSAAVTTAIGPVNCDAWHHLVIGNDQNVNPTGLWLDEFECFGSFSG